MTTSPNATVTANANRLYASHKPDGKPASQTEFAKALGMTQSSVSRYLRGRAIWTVEAVYAWANALGVPVEQLIHEHQES